MLNTHLLALLRVSFLTALMAGSGLLSAAIIPEPPEIAARSHILIDLGSGQVLDEFKADEPMPPASLTKLMTSYVLAYELEKGSVSNSDLVTVSENAWAKKFPDSSLMYIEVGTKVSLEDLHRGIIISSGNDASVAVAEHLAGSESAFADVMNKHAEVLGLTGSHFVNSHGLPDSAQYMTARDLATLAGALITQFPEEYKIYSEKEFSYNNITQQNRNKLLWRESSVDGLKTGHTREAGYCLVASANRGDTRLISVVMGTKTVESRNREAQKLLAYGFRYFESYVAGRASETLTTSKVWEGESESLNLGVSEDLQLTLPKGKKNQIELVYELPDDLVAPIEAGQAYGKVNVVLDGETLQSAPLVALDGIAQAGLIARLMDSVKRRFAGFVSSLGE